MKVDPDITDYLLEVGTAALRGEHKNLGDEVGIDPQRVRALALPDTLSWFELVEEYWNLRTAATMTLSKTRSTQARRDWKRAITTYTRELGKADGEMSESECETHPHAPCDYECETYWSAEGYVTHGAFRTYITELDHDFVIQGFVTAYNEQRISRHTACRNLLTVWSHAEAPLETMGRENWAMLFESVGYVNDDGPAERPSEAIRLYRAAVNAEAAISGWSWTSSRKVAEKFIHWAGQERQIFEADVDPAHLLGYTDSRHEQEHLVSGLTLSDVRVSPSTLPPPQPIRRSR
ncbi:hypothetical protein [Mycolicibacter arupensis]|uniref:Uncharacterized protein n=1 Tax=Mycolicibacter arupensis TaxID=342002 RepID=A0A5C7Y2B2_9MYCO|nr:hypothetical protein [Mycolicibacter arupensis]TXI55910.1 MAG: hypothetical protein E6Q54_11825 [Mycolicibacter arupensis]